MLTRLTDDGDLLEGIFELDNATNDRLFAESGLLPGIDARELVFGIPSYRIINAAFCHPAPNGSRFNSADRGDWYAGFELETSQAEVAYHKQPGCKKRIGTKRKSLSTSIIRQISALNSMTFEGLEEVQGLPVSNQLCRFAGTRCRTAGSRLGGNRVSQRSPLWGNVHRVLSAGIVIPVFWFGPAMEVKFGPPCE